MVNSLWFALRLRLLSKRTSKILDNILKSSFDCQDGLEILERETNTCLAMLEQLVDYAQKHHLGMGSEERQISQKILQDLNKAEKTIQRKKMPWWKKLLRLVAELLPFIQQLLLMIEIIIPNPLTKLLIGAIDSAVKFLPYGN